MRVFIPFILLCAATLGGYSVVTRTAVGVPADPADVVLAAKQPVPDRPTHSSVTFTLANTTGRPVRYLGYSVDNPWYSVQQLVDGQWVDHILGWCGTGLDERELGPGESVEFSAYIPETGVKTRVGVTFHFKGDKPDAGIVAWSDAVEIPRDRGRSAPTRD